MSAKLTDKNLMTIPKDSMASGGVTGEIDVDPHNWRSEETFELIDLGDTVRAKLAELALTEADISDAVAWVRHTGQSNNEKK